MFFSFFLCYVLLGLIILCMGDIHWIRVFSYIYDKEHFLRRKLPRYYNDKYPGKTHVLEYDLSCQCRCVVCFSFCDNCVLLFFLSTVAPDLNFLACGRTPHSGLFASTRKTLQRALYFAKWCINQICIQTKFPVLFNRFPFSTVRFLYLLF
jgi:hypothetical protein